MIDRQGQEDQAEEEAPTMFLESVCKHKIVLKVNEDDIAIIWT